jgi:hypothetical protein
MSENRSKVGLVLRGVGLAMGVVVVNLSIIGGGDTNLYASLLGIGLAALGLDALRGKP